MAFERFDQMLRRLLEAIAGRRNPQLSGRSASSVNDEEDVGAVRLLHLQAALKERRVSEPEG